MRNKWHDFWAGQTSPRHRSDSALHYTRYGAELKVLFPDRPIRRVLEIGCGDGALFEPLGFDRVDYTGVDFSRSMLDAFAKRHPNVRLIEAAGDAYVDDGGYDLIFSNGVIQNFDRRMFDQFVANANRMLTPDGLILVGSIPWTARKVGYCTGWLTGRQPSLVRQIGGIPGSLFIRSMGRWYSYAEIRRAAERHDLTSELFGSLLYPYRFHSRLHRGGQIIQ